MLLQSILALLLLAFPVRGGDLSDSHNLTFSESLPALQSLANEPSVGPAEVQAAKTPTEPAPPPKPRPAYRVLSANEYKLFIYQHESGNDPKRRNSSGCLGLGQACPGSKLLAVCPNLDYNCEDQYFTNYAISRYGSWQNAYSFWITHRWW